jgi:hypothetical protein
MVSRYVHFENIRRFEEMLLTETSPKKRAVLLRLLAEERAKDIEAHAAPEQPGDDEPQRPSAGGGS